jgi:hypothetical protein
MCKAPAVDHQKLKKFDIAACQTLMQEPFVSTVNEALGTGDNNPKSRLCFPLPHAQHPIEPPLHWLHNATAAGRLQKGRGFVRCSVGDAGEKKRFTFHVSLGTLEDPKRCVSSRRDVSLREMDWKTPILIRRVASETLRAGSRGSI